MKNGGVTKATDKSAIEISSKKLAEMGEKKSVNIFDLAQQQLVQKRSADDARERLWSARQTAVDAGGPEEKGRVADSEAAESTMVFCGAPNSVGSKFLQKSNDGKFLLTSKGKNLSFGPLSGLRQCENDHRWRCRPDCGLGVLFQQSANGQRC
jgi:hypothetical protein